jgi:tRNA threonylcarbamoyladenosine biosynthesis protein TsaE
MIVKDAAELIDLGKEYGRELKGGEVIELVGDVGVGKTTFTQGLAAGLGVAAAVNSPSFTIMKSYAGRDGLVLNHYDFYRLDDAGIMRAELADSLSDRQNVTVVEWAKDTAGVLPTGRRIVKIQYLPDAAEGREVTYVSGA